MPDLAYVSEEDVERLASRLAMVVSHDGEAENAGRALGSSRAGWASPAAS